MTAAFKFEPSPSHVDVRLATPHGPLPADRWALDAPASLLTGVDLARRLEAAGGAIIEQDAVLVEHRAIAGLTASERDNRSMARRRATEPRNGPKIINKQLDCLRSRLHYPLPRVRNQFRPILEMHRVVVIPFAAPDEAVLLEHAYDLPRDLVLVDH
jgi:hypothetical protein